MEAQIEILLDLHRMESANGGIYTGDNLQKAEERLDPSLLNCYRRIKQRRGSGVAILKDRTCSGCRMVYPEAHSIVRCKDLIHKCEYCGRLLVASNNIERSKPQSVIPFVALPALEGTEVSPVAVTCLLETVEEAIDPALNSQGSREGLKAVLTSVEQEKSLILYVDDDQEYRKLMRRAMEEAGFAVVEAGSGREALEQLDMKKIDLVISEVKIPDFSGYDLMKKIRTLGIEAEVIFLTAYGEWESYVDLMNSGAFDYVNKSSSNDEILGLISQALD